MNKKLKILVIGFGRVAKEFIKKLLKIKKKIKLILVVRKNRIFERRFIEKLKTSNNVRILTNYKRYISKNTILVELIGDNFFSKDILFRSVLNNAKLVTANKNVLYKNIKITKHYINKSIFIEASIGGGVPLIRTISNLSISNNVVGLSSIVNGTTNYILYKFNKERNILNSKRKAELKGLSERNAKRDMFGFDNASKLMILANMLFRGLKIRSRDDILVQGIDKIVDSDIYFLLKNKVTIKLVSFIVTGVNLIQLETSPIIFRNIIGLKRTNNEYNKFIIKTNSIGSFSIKAKGAGPKVTAFSVLSDLVNKSMLLNISYNERIHVSGFFKTKVLILVNQNESELIINYLFRIGFIFKFKKYSNRIAIMISNKICNFRSLKFFKKISKKPVILKLI
ncbi:hypothetical protein ACWNX4_00515 [Candidatus Vidania fulgoroideorum]